MKALKRFAIGVVVCCLVAWSLGILSTHSRFTETGVAVSFFETRDGTLGIEIKHNLEFSVSIEESGNSQVVESKFNGISCSHKVRHQSNSTTDGIPLGSWAQKYEGATYQFGSVRFQVRFQDRSEQAGDRKPDPVTI